MQVFPQKICTSFSKRKRERIEWIVTKLAFIHFSTKRFFVWGAGVYVCVSVCVCV